MTTLTPAGLPGSGPPSAVPSSLTQALASMTIKCGNDMRGACSAGFASITVSQSCSTMAVSRMIAPRGGGGGHEALREAAVELTEERFLTIT